MEMEMNRDGGEMRIDIPALIQRRRARRRRSSRFQRTSRMIIETSLALGGQAIGAVVAVALTSCTSSWPLYSTELCILLGLIFIFAALALRREQPQLSAVTAKIGAVATALATVIAVTSHLPPLLAFAAGLLAFLMISVAVAFAS